MKNIKYFIFAFAITFCSNLLAVGEEKAVTEYLKNYLDKKGDKIFSQKFVKKINKILGNDKPDFKALIKLLQEEKENNYAKYFLAIMHETGVGVDRNLKKTADLYWELGEAKIPEVEYHFYWVLTKWLSFYTSDQNTSKEKMKKAKSSIKDQSLLFTFDAKNEE